MRPEPSPNPCLEFEAVTNAVLDRDLPPSALESPHASECPACRELAGSVQMLLSALASPLPAPPDGFAFRVVAAAVRDRKRQLRLRWAKRAGGLAVAAAVVLAVYLGTKPPVATPAPEVAIVVPKPEPIPTPRPARVSDKLAEAGEAFAAITQRTADEALTPTRNLFPMPEPVALPHVPEIVPETDPLAQLPGAAKAGLEPVTSSAKRAWNVFVRDVVPGKGSS
jgi:hypothetical protein